MLVDEYDAPIPEFNGIFTSNNEIAGGLPPITLKERIAQAAQEYGIVRPQGRVVSFHYNPAVEGHHFGRSHPMKPWRLHLTKQLVMSYGLQYAMDCYTTMPASREELAVFHRDDYLEFLSEITPDNMKNYESAMQTFNFGDDCPVFDGLYDYCSMYTGASLSAARTLTSALAPGAPSAKAFTSSGMNVSGASDIAINWSGGLHHAFKAAASGFCYINDIVLTIQHLLQYHPRVLYIDIDVHHGDGVEAAFHSSDRVLTLSFHKYEPLEFFPGTGGLHEQGPGDPRNPGFKHSLNVPLRDGIDDDQYERLFRSIAGKAMETFRPTCVVFQCGADSLGGDRLGRLNLNIKGHGACLSFIKAYHIPLLVLGGGGYTARNVARLWCHETSICTESVLQNNVPDWVPYRQAFTGTERGSGLLYPELGGRHRNDNDEKYLENLVRKTHEQLRYLRGAPSVEMTRLPRDIWAVREEVERRNAEENMDNDHANGQRKEWERNIGGRNEYPE